MELSRLDRCILRECAADYLGLWSVIFEVRAMFPRLGAPAVQRMTVDSLARLLDARLIRAGYPTPDGRGFEPWLASAEEAIARIRDEWNALGREPSIGEVAWFASTPGGERLVAQERSTPARR